MVAGSTATFGGPSASAGVHALAQPWASNNTGGVAVVFESPFPEVSLVQNANASVSADLQVDGILELSAQASPHPRAVAVALPLSVSHFNGTPPGNAPRPWSFNLTAVLAVYPTDLALWNGSGATPPTPLGPPFGEASLRVEYTVEPASSSSGAVAVAWSVTNWPWSSMDDVLALESHFSMTPASSLYACSGVSTLTQAACPGQQVPVSSAGSVQWGTDVVGLEEDNTSGPAAAVNWSPTLALSGSVAGTARVTSGLDVASPGSVEFVLGGVGDGATSIAGSMSLALSAGVGSGPASTLGPLTATPVVYLASAAGFAVLAALGVSVYRRREAKAREEL